MKAFISILLICGFIIIDGVKAQDNYTTTNGLIVITATIDDKPVIYASDELQATLNYQTAEIEFELSWIKTTSGLMTILYYNFSIPVYFVLPGN
jgi:hypothetical protein